LLPNASLPEISLPVMVSGPELKMPPPSRPEVLSFMIVSMSVSEPMLWFRMPPPMMAAWFPEISHPSRVRLPQLTMPPPPSW
jgi:hypothetical protein